MKIKLPTKDSAGNTFPTIRLGQLEFEAGKTYEVTEERAAQIKERAQAWNHQTDRLMYEPKPSEADLKRKRECAGWSTPYSKL